MLRSREIRPAVSGKPRPKRTAANIQPSTPARTQETNVHRSRIDRSGPVDVPTYTSRRRSLRLAHQCNGYESLNEKEVGISICGKRKSNVDETFLSLRSGKRVAKRVLVDNGGSDGLEIDSRNLDFESELDCGSKRKKVVNVSISDEDSQSCIVATRMANEEKGQTVNAADRSPNGMLLENCAQVLLVESKNKGKGIVEDSHQDNDVQVKRADSYEKPSSSMGRRKYTREEKGKGIQVENVSSPITNQITGVGVEEMGIDNSVNNHKPPDASGPELSAAVNAEQRQIHNGDEIRKASRTRHFHDIAKKNASRFAHFDAQLEEEDDLSDKEVEQQVEDWPGPFSTAMKIIKDREEDTNLCIGSFVSNKERSSPIIWAPRRNYSVPPLRAPSLQELSLRILVKNADAISSLDYVPDALRVKLCQLLCDSRRMDVHILDLLVRGSPTGICVPDCSWLTEEQFTECFKNCDTSNLMVSHSYKFSFNFNKMT